MEKIIIVGGGLAGLVSAIALQRKGFETVVIERNDYPSHKVCGEYISNEVVPYLKEIDCYPDHLDLAKINRFVLSDIYGREGSVWLDQGGFGVSRYLLDDYLAQKARAAGAELRTQTRVEAIDWRQDHFELQLHSGEQLRSPLVIGAYGKRSRVDKQLNRGFMHAASPYVGVKYHIKTDFDPMAVALHNFARGYCGLSRIEGDTYNLCYLASRELLRKAGSITALEEQVLQQNPRLQAVWKDSDFVFEQPKVINEISFAPKAPVEQHILMAGDTAGLITPLCGNGMAMAIHAAKLCTDSIARHYSPKGTLNRPALEQDYTRSWRAQFASRLWVGRTAQRAFGHQLASSSLVALVRYVPPLARMIIRQTHGAPF